MVGDVIDSIGCHGLLVCPPRPRVSVKSLVGQVMMVEISILSLHTLVETFMVVSICACIVSFLKTVVQNMFLGMIMPSSTYGWTRHRWRMCANSMLKVFSRIYVFSFRLCIL